MFALCGVSTIQPPLAFALLVPGQSWVLTVTDKQQELTVTRSALCLPCGNQCNKLLAAWVVSISYNDLKECAGHTCSDRRRVPAPCSACCH